MRIRAWWMGAILSLFVLASPVLQDGHLLAQTRKARKPGRAHGFRRYSDLLAAIKKRGHRMRVLGYAPDRSPVVVKTGGEKKPAILISAGSHSTEHPGVVAAVELMDELKTPHQVYILQGARAALHAGGKYPNKKYPPD